MKKILDLLGAEVAKAFAAAGYDEKYARVSISNRPDLCEYQCNGAMAAAKEYHKAPIMIANGVVGQLAGSEVLGEVQAVNPGFINMKINDAFLGTYLNDLKKQNIRRPLSLITADRMWQNHFMWDTYVPLSSARVLRELHGLQDIKSSATCIWETGVCRWG